MGSEHNGLLVWRFPNTVVSLSGRDARARPDPTRHTTKTTTHHMYSIGGVLLSGLCGGAQACINSCNPSKHFITFDQFIHFIAFKHSFIHSFIDSFIYSFMHSFIFLIHSLIHLFIHFSNSLILFGLSFRFLLFIHFTRASVLFMHALN